MANKPKIALIIGSTRKTRFADIPAAWMKAQADARGDMDVEVVDLRDFALPMFDEPASDAYMPSSNAAAVAWQKKIASFDGYIFVVAEYNHSVTGALKNALDQAYVAWAKKPMAAIAYGSMGGARALEHLRGIAVGGCDPRRSGLVGQGDDGCPRLTQDHRTTGCGQGFGSGRCHFRKSRVLRKPRLVQEAPLRHLGIDPPGQDLAPGAVRHRGLDQRHHGGKLHGSLLRPRPVEHPLIFHRGRQPPGADGKLTQQGIGRSGGGQGPEHKDGQKSFQTARHFSIWHAESHFFKAI